MTAVEHLPPTTAVADVLATRGRTGWLSPPLRLVVADGAADHVTGGTALTVELRHGPGGFGPLYEVLSGDLAGRALVVVAPDDDAAVWGELLTMAAAQRSAAAVLVAGAVRDVTACESVGLPLWSRAVRTVGPAGLLEVAAVGRPVGVGQVTVTDGDLVVLDTDGVVAIPAAPSAGARGDAQAVLADARAYAAAEDQVAVALGAGVALREAYRSKAELVARLRSRDSS